MKLLMDIVQSQNTTPPQKDGALHMIGTMADILLKKKTYKDQLEQFLVNIVFPEFNSPHGHLRARACWMLHYFAGKTNKHIVDKKGILLSHSTAASTAMKQRGAERSSRPKI